MIKTTKDGRKIRTREDYTDFRHALHIFQGGHCAHCGLYTQTSLPLESSRSFHIHHVHGRGMGGSKRDDTLEACQGLCGKCHREEHGQ